MFNRNELIHIYNNITDIGLKEKIERMIFVNKDVIKKILESFDEKSIIAIDKDTDSNKYVIHFYEDYLEKIDEIRICIDIAHSFDDDMEIDSLTHENDTTDFWRYSMIEVWNPKDGYLKTELDKKDA